MSWLISKLKAAQCGKSLVTAPNSTKLWTAASTNQLGRKRPYIKGFRELDNEIDRAYATRACISSVHVVIFPPQPAGEPEIPKKHSSDFTHQSQTPIPPLSAVSAMTEPSLAAQHRLHNATYARTRSTPCLRRPRQPKYSSNLAFTKAPTRSLSAPLMQQFSTSTATVSRTVEEATLQEQLARTAQVQQQSFPSFYRRELPADLVHFNSELGRQYFREAMLDGTMELYFPLAEQFLTQAEPAYCAISTLAMCFNALGVDPGKQWKRPWRWFSEEMLECCTPLDTIMKEGLTFRQFASLARCHGVLVEDYRADLASVDHFRSVLEQLSTTSSVVKDGHASTSITHDPHRAGLRAALVVSFSRQALNQTGDGHMSPIGGYHRKSDSVLILDVARFKYPPYWVPVQRLYDSMLRCDKVSSMPRGYCVLTPLISRQSAVAGAGTGGMLDLPLQVDSVETTRSRYNRLNSRMCPDTHETATDRKTQSASQEHVKDESSSPRVCPKCNRPDGACAQPTYHSHMSYASDVRGAYPTNCREENFNPNTTYVSTSSSNLASFSTTTVKAQGSASLVSSTTASNSSATVMSVSTVSTSTTTTVSSLPSSSSINVTSSTVTLTTQQSETQESVPKYSSSCILDLDPGSACPPKIRRWIGKLRI